MGNRAIYTLVENGGKHLFLLPTWVQNALSPLFTAVTRQKSCKQSYPNLNLLHTFFEHLDYDGQYQNPRLMDADMFL